MKILNSNTEEKIMEAAKEVFMKYGLYGARMQDIADSAGINKALLHYYFRNKEKLFDQVFEGALSKYFENMWIFSDKSIPVQERVLTYVEKIIDFLSEYPQMSMFIIKEISINPEIFREKVMSLKKDRTSNLLAALNEGIENNEIAPIEPIVFMINLHSLCAYPFLASPIFKAIVNSNEMDWEDAQNQKLKQSVKEFVEFKLSKNTNLK